MVLCCLVLDTELDRDAEEEQIKVAYRRLAKFYHPDGVYLDLETILYMCL